MVIALPYEVKAASNEKEGGNETRVNIQLIDYKLYNGDLAP
jgi:hypothetical protein